LLIGVGDNERGPYRFPLSPLFPFSDLEGATSDGWISARHRTGEPLGRLSDEPFCTIRAGWVSSRGNGRCWAV